MVPEEILAKYSGLRDMWRVVNIARAESVKKQVWPAYVFFPVQNYGYMLRNTHIFKGVADDDIDYIVYELAACGSWRVTKDVVRFDKDLFDSLVNTPLVGNIPCDVLRRMPAWCVYIETPGLYFHSLDETIHGFWAYLDRVKYKGQEPKDRLLLCIIKDGELLRIYNGRTVEMPLEDRTVEEVMYDTINVNFAHGKITQQRHKYLLEKCKFIANETSCLLNLVLYLCAYGFPGSGGNGTEVPIQRPQPKKTKKGWRLFAANKVTIRHIGKEVGDSIRRAREAESSSNVKRASMSPHVRRGHWHGYWHGPKKDKDGAALQQKYKLNWLPPMAVALRDDEEVETAETA